MLTTRQTKVQHRIFFPFYFQFFYSQTLEKLFLTLKIAFQSRNQQRFTKTTWTTEEYVLHIPMRHTIYIFRLVYIELILLTYFRECLYT